MRALILFLLTFICSTNLFAQSYNEQVINLQVSKLESHKDWTGTIDKDVPVRRSISFQPVYAYLINNIVRVEFEETLSTVAISLFCATSGEGVYSEVFHNPINQIIDMSTESHGTYILKIELDEMILEGYIILK